MLRSVLILFSNGLFIPFLRFLRQLFIPNDGKQAFAFRLQDRLIGVRNEFRARHIDRHAACGRIRDWNGKTGLRNGLGPIDITGHALIGTDQRVGVVFLQPLAPVPVKAIRPPFLVDPLIQKAGLLTILLNGVAQVHQYIFSFFRKVDQRDPMIGNTRFQLGDPAERRCVIVHCFSS